MTKQLKVTVDGKVYQVTVEFTDDAPEMAAPAVLAPVSLPVVSAPVAAPAAAPAPTAAPAAPSGPGGLRSPLAGKVVAVEVQVGQAVTEGQRVVTLEAMKMNTYINAPKAGKVTAVHVHPGDAVDEGAPLLEIA